MKTLRLKHVHREEYDHLIDMYFKLEMKHVMEKILFAYNQGYFNTTVEVVKSA